MSSQVYTVSFASIILALFLFPIAHADTGAINTNFGPAAAVSAGVKGTSDTGASRTDGKDEGEGVKEGQAGETNGNKGEGESGASMVWSSYVGGTGLDESNGIAVDSGGNVYITGTTQSSGWVSGGWIATFGGESDGYVVKLNASGAHQWSTYVGGTGLDEGKGIAVDSGGNVYITGTTQSSGWVSGGWKTTLSGENDGYVVKLNTSGAHQWSTYLGGLYDDQGYGIAVDASGNCYATGHTASPDWVSGGFKVLYSGNTDGYIVKFSNLGIHQWSTYVGGTNLDVGRGIGVDANGNCYAGGATLSPGWASGGFNTMYRGGTLSGDGYVVKLSSAGNHVWSTYLGGSNDDGGYSIALDAIGSCYAVGSTESLGWVSGGWNPVHNGGVDGFVVKLSSAGAHLWSSYVGGTDTDACRGVAVDSNGNCYITGDSMSSGWVDRGWDTSLNGNYDGFVLKLSTTGSTLWSSYLGGANEDHGIGAIVDASGNCYVAGTMQSSGWASGGWDTTLEGNQDGFVAKISQLPEPEAPVNPGATAIGPDTITWTWEDASLDELGFKIFVDEGAGFPTTLRFTTAADEEAWVENSLLPNRQYSFQAAATNTQGDSARSSNFTAWTLAAVPAAPVLGNRGPHSLDVGIGPNDGNPAYTQYAIRFSSPSSDSLWLQGNTVLGAEPVFQTSASWGFATVNNLEEGTTYTFSAVARNGAGIETAPGAATAVTTLSPQAEPPSEPSLGWATYVGGTGDDFGTDIALDTVGNCYITGYTTSPGWVNGGWDTDLGGTSDGYVIKLNAAGSHVWSTYLGGTGDDQGTGIAVDAQGNCYIAGITNSQEWVNGGGQTTYGGGSYDGFVVKLNPAGAHQWSTYVGSVNADTPSGIALDAAGNCYVPGTTNSPNWMQGGWKTVYAGGAYDGFLVKLNNAGAVQWSTYLGGTSEDRGNRVAVDASGYCYVIGTTESAGWVSGGWDTTHGGGGYPDGYVVKFNASGQHLWSTYVGGDGFDLGQCIAVDGMGNCYAAGQTNSGGWVSGGWNTVPNGTVDGFVVKLNPQGLHEWSTYLGGITEDRVNDIAADENGNTYITGQTDSAEWMIGGFDTTPNGWHDGFVVKLSSTGAHFWSTCLGGVNNDWGQGIAVDGNRNCRLTGTTYSPDWISGGWNSHYGGSADAFMMKITQHLEPAAPTNPGAKAVGKTSITWTWHDNTSIELGYKVWVDMGTDAPVTLRTTTAPNTEAWIHSGLRSNTQYAFQTAATNANGDSAKTDVYTAWTLAAVPAAPLLGHPTLHSLDVSIAEGDGNPPYTLYTLRISTLLGDNIWVQSDGTLGAVPCYQTAAAWGTLTVTGLAENDLYGFSARAKNELGIETTFGPNAFATTHDVEGEGGIEGEGDIEGEGAFEGEGVIEGEGAIEGEGEGALEGEGGAQEGEGAREGDEEDGRHTADQNADHLISLSELLRPIQFFNTRGFHCQAGTEDGYAPGPEGDTSCTPHDSDYNPQDWRINLYEILRLIQFFNSGGYHYCPGVGTEDGFCPGPA